MLVPFPTRPRQGCRLGWPERAGACECPVAILDEPGGTCVACGRYHAGVIDETWRRRAQALTGRDLGLVAA